MHLLKLMPWSGIVSWENGPCPKTIVLSVFLEPSWISLRTSQEILYWPQAGYSQQILSQCARLAWQVPGRLDCVASVFPKAFDMGEGMESVRSMGKNGPCPKAMPLSLFLCISDCTGVCWTSSRVFQERLQWVQARHSQLIPPHGMNLAEWCHKELGGWG